MRVLIAGGGQVAGLIASRLIREGNDLVIVEPNPDRCAQLDGQLDARIVQGSAARIRTMREAGIATVDLVIAVTDSDEVNLLACVIAQAESPRSVRVARVRTHEAPEWRDLMARSQVRIDQIIHPETDVADLVMRVIRVPGVSDIREFAGGAVTLFGMHVPPHSWLDGRTLVEIGREAPAASALVAMIFRWQQVIIARGHDEVREGDHLYVLTTRDHLEAHLRFYGLGAAERLRRVLMLGGKRVGILLAQRLEAQGVSVRLFERDTRRTEKIAGLLRRSVVVDADGTDQRVLEEEGLEGADAFLALTNHDEDDIIASLLARRIGVPKVVALINRLNYLPMVQRLGVNTTVSLRVAAVDRILQFVRQGRVLSVTTFREEEAEAIEVNCHTFSTLGTGGFSTRTAIVGAATMLVALSLVIQAGQGLWHALRAALFQVSSIVTTTGFASEDFERWPPLPRLVLLALMFIGGCTGSTAGGLKVSRVMLLARVVDREFRRMVERRGVFVVRLGDEVIAEPAVQSLLNLVYVAFVVNFVSCLLLAATGADILTSITAVAASMFNVGSGFGLVGASEHYGHLPAAAKWVLAADMIAGRLEFFTLLVIFTPAFWRR